MPDTASTADHAASDTIANTGVPNRASMFARRAKNTPSRAIAKYMRGAVRKSPFVALKIDTRISAPTIFPAAEPKIVPTASAAT